MLTREHDVKEKALPQLLVAPHRVMFFTGGVQIIWVMALWVIEMLSRLAGDGLDWPWPAGWWHALLTLYGVFPFFVFGFLLTAMPRWQSCGEIPPRHYVWPWQLLVTGWVLVSLGIGVPGLRVPGLLTVAAGWLALCAVLLPVALRGGGARVHALPAWCALLVGALGILVWAHFAAYGDGRWARWAIQIGIWGCLLPIFLTVCHRMLPFFSNSVLPDYTMYRPRWVLHALLAASLLHGLMGMLAGIGWTWIVDLPAAVLGVYLTVRWGLMRSFKVRLLAMLHLGFAWFGIAMSLFAVQSLGAALGYDVLGMAPLHALLVGMFAVTVLAMVSRVTLGHAGRALAADKVNWTLCWALQTVAVLRILAELVPSSQAGLLVIAAFGWLAVFGIWAARFLPVYLRPRADGRPG